MPPAWEAVICSSAHHFQTQPGTSCSLALKIEHSGWTFMVLGRTLCSGPPTPGLCPCLASSSCSGAVPTGPLRGDLVDLRGQPWPRPSSHGSQPPFSRSPTSHAARGWDVLCLFLPPPQLAESALVQPCAGAGTPHARAAFGLAVAVVALGLPVLGLESAWSIPSC